MNYAEDKDNDMDYEYTSTPSAASSSSKSTAGVTTEVAVMPTTASSRRASAVGGTGGKDKEGAKETTAMVATTTSTGSKKRKNHHIAPVMPRDMGLSNMLSFENPRLKDGQLIADDGTTLSVNGTNSMFLTLELSVPSFLWEKKPPTRNHLLFETLPSSIRFFKVLPR